MAGSGRLALRTLAGLGWVRGSDPAVLSRLRDEAVVRPDFLSAAEEETLRRELEPELRRRRYEYDHWDAVALRVVLEPQLPSLENQLPYPRPRLCALLPRASVSLVALWEPPGFTRALRAGHPRLPGDGEGALVRGQPGHPAAHAGGGLRPRPGPALPGARVGPGASGLRQAACGQHQVLRSHHRRPVPPVPERHAAGARPGAPRVVGTPAGAGLPLHP
ncbi:alpha-ketoglutarate-dependent dioxygenase alkB homolog 7, mitochondrial isoform X1 [Tamandua tetradactyla]|uniref:alpha-ketoglutarate-dependent dioxygenase alkB homolog 7, mitochondrial isoform X1 n=1 Tax=Tamandua tetradactyla TaxID=48850 RepID=UPI0040543C4D